MMNFDQFIGIDWSGAKSPIYTKSISIAQCQRDGRAPALIRNAVNRNDKNRNNWSRKDVFQFIQTIAQRTLIGIDANLGYAEEAGVAQLGKHYNYKDLWREVEKASTHAENFFAGGFWECYHEFFWTHGKMPAHMIFPKRHTEITCAEKGLGIPESPFKLIGAKQVGKGGLAAMRMAHALKHEMGDQMCIWPFEKHIADSAQIVITEIFPRQFLMRCEHGSKKVNTVDELNAALKKLDCKNNFDTDAFNDHNADAIVSSAGLRMLCGEGEAIPKEISSPTKMNSAAQTREGWIFGV